MPPLQAARAGLLTLFVAELLYLTIRFDSQGLETSSSPWIRLVGWSPQLLRFAISGALVCLLLNAKRLWAARTAPSTLSFGAIAGWTGIHIAALFLFIDSSDRIFSGGASHAGVRVSLWLLSGAGMVASWTVLFMARSPRALRRPINQPIAIGAGALAAAAVGAGMLTESLWRSVASQTFALAGAMLRLVHTDVVSEPETLVLGTSTFTVAIAPTCSGLEGVGLILTFLTAYLWWFRRELRFPAALVLLPIGAISIWLLNAVRIVVLIVIGSAGWPDVALGGFHSQAGWISFNVVALGFVAIVNRGGLFMKPSSFEAAPKSDDTTAAYLAPFVVVLATGLATGAFSSGIDWLYPLRVVAAGSVLWIFRRHYAALNWKLSWRAIAIGLGTFAIWLALAPAGDPTRDQWPAGLESVPQHWAAAWLLFRIVGFTLTVPIVEELAFRAYLSRRLIAANVEHLPLGVFTWSSFALSSVLFGLMHGGFWLAGTIAGMAFALALYHRRSLGDAVVAHATTNALIVVYVLATGRWSVWS